MKRFNIATRVVLLMRKLFKNVVLSVYFSDMIDMIEVFFYPPFPFTINAGWGYLISAKGIQKLKIK